MLDRQLRRWIDPWLDAAASMLYAWGVSPNAITLTGFFVGAAGCLAIATERYGSGLALILVNRLADGLDGCVARRTGPTDLGGFLDIVLDTIFYAAVPFAFGLTAPERLLPACFLIFSFVGTGGSFLAFAAISAKRGIVEGTGRKSFFYSAGLMEGGETVFFFILFCVFPASFAVLAWTFGGLCWLTTAIRIVTGWIVFRETAASRSRAPGVDERRD